MDALGEAAKQDYSPVVRTFIMLSMLSVIPALLIGLTSFTRIIVVLSFLRTALGIQQAPPNQVLISLALFLTFFVMQPTLERSWNDGVRPLIEGTIDEGRAFERALAPVRSFMAANVRPQDLALFEELSGAHTVPNPAGALRSTSMRRITSQPASR